MPSRIWNPFSIYSFNPPQRVGQNTRGIVSLNPNLELHPLFITRDQRLIVCQITHIQAHFPPIIVCNIYAPAQSKERQVFYDAILSLHIFQTSSLRTLSDPSSIDGTSDPGSHADVLSTFLDSPMWVILTFMQHHMLLITLMIIVKKIVYHRLNN